jgi:hypothetical protein
VEIRRCKRKAHSAPTQGAILVEASSAALPQGSSWLRRGNLIWTEHHIIIMTPALDPPSGPPLLPWLMAASVWMYSARVLSIPSSEPSLPIHTPAWRHYPFRLIGFLSRPPPADSRLPPPSSYYFAYIIYTFHIFYTPPVWRNLPPCDGADDADGDGVGKVLGAAQREDPLPSPLPIPHSPHSMD